MHNCSKCGCDTRRPLVICAECGRPSGSDSLFRNYYKQKAEIETAALQGVMADNVALRTRLERIERLVQPWKCLATDNPCGTDTLSIRPCLCHHCQIQAALEGGPK